MSLNAPPLLGDMHRLIIDVTAISPARVTYRYEAFILKVLKVLIQVHLVTTQVNNGNRTILEQILCQK